MQTTNAKLAKYGNTLNTHCSKTMKVKIYTCYDIFHVFSSVSALSSKSSHKQAIFFLSFFFVSAIMEQMA
jgi:hypothetical protein